MPSPVIFLRVWQAGAGLSTALLVAHYLTPEHQGWYYSFLSIVALHTLFDLGLSTVLVQVSSHESIGLQWGKGYCYTGPKKNSFTALLISAVRFYLMLAVAFAALVLPSGYIFFSYRESDISSWQWPWLFLCLGTTASLIVMPFMSMLEGAGHIRAVYRVRLIQAIGGSIACWLMLAFGGGLWAPAMMPILAITITLGWLWRKAPSFFINRWSSNLLVYDWRKEVWPLQWRVGLGWLSGYLVTQINIPILFITEGSVLAGQFGLSLAVVNTIGLVCQSWFTRHVPEMARSVISKDWETLDTVFFKDLIEATVIFFVSSVSLLIGYLLFKDSSIVSRLLPFWSFAGLLIFAFVSFLVSAWAIQLRSFRQEPLLSVVFFSNLLIVPSVLLATRWFSINGMIAVLDVVYLLILLPKSWVIWRSCNRAWRDSVWVLKVNRY